VLDSGEALFFDGGDQLTVADNRRRSVTVIGIDTNDVHISLSLLTTRLALDYYVDS
jgi:hypothetical protein